MQYRVVVTGVGVVAPGGVGREAFWKTLVGGVSTSDKTPVDRPERFRSQIAASVADWKPATYGFTEQESQQLDRHIQFALVAAGEAWADAGLDLTLPTSQTLGVVAGTAIGSSSLLEREYFVVSRQATDFNVDPELASPYLFDAFNPSYLSASIASRFGATGPVQTISSGCTAGIDAIAQAFEWIASGDAEVVVAGASEAGICPINIASFDVIKATSSRNDDPKKASRPFDKKRDGFVLGEGSAFLILERFEHAQTRQAHIYGEITGYGSAMNAYHMTGLPRDGHDMVQAITVALENAGVAPSAIHYINAHGSSTLQNDVHETSAFKAVWKEGAYHIPISSIKSMIGHSLGAIGAIELAACALALDRGIVPPTINYENPDPTCDLDYIPNQSRCLPIRTLISTASGFGGFQSAMVMSKVEV